MYIYDACIYNAHINGTCIYEQRSAMHEFMMRVSTMHISVMYIFLMFVSMMYVHMIYVSTMHMSVMHQTPRIALFVGSFVRWLPKKIAS